VTLYVSEPDHYQILGITPTATLEQIKAAYRRQALRHHPDKNPDSNDAADRFKLCNEAFAVLSDPARRSEYDDRGRGVQDLARDIIGDLLGRRRRRRDGKDLQFNLHISLQESIEGTHKQIDFPATQSCTTCRGSGAGPTGRVRCPSCNGRGEIRDGTGLLSLPRSCPRCGGQGVMVTSPCKACGGVGMVEQERMYSVKLPPGVRQGDVKIIDGQGEQGVEGGRPGDLHIVVHVDPHPLMEAEGENLVLDLPVSLALAALGGVVDVPTPDGVVRMKVPAGTQSGRVFRLRGRGLWSGTGRGDELVRVVVETPTNLDPDGRQWLRSFGDSCGADSHPRCREFQEQLRAPTGALHSTLQTGSPGPRASGSSGSTGETKR